MGNSVPITTTVLEIALNRLVPSKHNVRKTERDSGIEELAASILAHGVLQNLTVKPEFDDEKRETGRYEVVAGERRLAALTLLAKRKKIAKTIAIACNIRQDSNAKELSLVENVQRVNLHPADQFEAFKALHDDEGFSADDIAARFGVTVRTVRERLKLGAVSPKLMTLHREAVLTLDQIMAFAVLDDPNRQEEVYNALTYDRSPRAIRRLLLQGHVPAEDKRACFVGLEAYEAAGGGVLRDLFAEDGGGYLTDPLLLERLAKAKLDAEADKIRSEGWKWVESYPDFPYSLGLKRIYPHEVPLSEADAARLEAIEAELDRLGAEREALQDDDPALQATMKALSAEYDAIDSRGRRFDPEDVAIAGAILSLDPHGEVSVVRGLIRPDDERKPVEAEGAPMTSRNTSAEPDEAGSEDATTPGLSDRLIADLSAQRTMAMRDQLALYPEMAHVALTHALALQLFYYGQRDNSCLALVASSPPLESHAPGINEGLAAKSIDKRHEAWATRIPKEAEDLWAFVKNLIFSERQALLAHCVGLLVDAVERDVADRRPASDVLADAIGLDMRAYWRPTVENYFGRVPKAMILQAVREGVSDRAAAELVDRKKDAMATAAEAMLTPTAWLPAKLRRKPPATAQAEQSMVAE